MIIKSMSRKAPTFGQLADYIARGSDPQKGTAFMRNLYADGRDQGAVVGQFLDNYRYLPERKGGNALYHEVIVLEPQGHLSPEAVEQALHDLAERYCQLRAPHQLAWGRVHMPSSSEAVGPSKSTQFPHIHLMISANAVRSDRRVRMEKRYFAKVQRDLETWCSAHLPALNCQMIYGRGHQKDTPKQPVQEGEMIRRTKRPSQKQQIFEALKSAMDKADSVEQLKAVLNAEGLTLYQRGKSYGIETARGRKYRLPTLGLEDAFRDFPEHSHSHKTTPQPKDTRSDDLLRARLAHMAQEELERFDRSDR